MNFIELWAHGSPEQPWSRDAISGVLEETAGEEHLWVYGSAERPYTEEFVHKFMADE